MIKKNSALNPRFRSLRDAGALQGLVDHLHEAFYITSARGELVDANAAFLAMLGVKSLAELRSYSLTDMIADPERRLEELDLLDTAG